MDIKAQCCYAKWPRCFNVISDLWGYEFEMLQLGMNF